MERIINGILYEGKRALDQWEVRVWEQAGHRETTVRPAIIWQEVGTAFEGLPAGMPPGAYVITTEELLEQQRLAAIDAIQRKADAIKSAAQRAKTACRRAIKAEGFNELGTLTYREDQTDRELCKKHFKEFIRRMKKAFGGEFRYCASFERQKLTRRAMHVHIAMHKFPRHLDAKYKGVKIPAWRVGTVIWRDIVGADNGMFFVGGKKKDGTYRRNMSLAKMAAYVSKYIMKDYEEAGEGTNRYSRSNGVPVTKPVLMRFNGCMLADLIGLVFQLGEGDVIVSHNASELHGSYWLCTEPEPKYVKRIKHPA